MNPNTSVLRKTLHQLAEPSGNEKNTAEKIIQILRALHPSYLITKLGGYGVAAIFDSNQPGPSILFRADIDALPIAESSSLPHHAILCDVSHKCGHDGHTAILLGVAQAISHQPPVTGKITLLFQPAEETGKGAPAVLSDEKFKLIKPQMVFALHNLPGYEKGHIIIRNNTFSAASTGMTAILSGIEAHASQPNTGISPVPALSLIITKLNLLYTQPQYTHQSLITIIHINAGKPAFGTAPGKATIMLTLRSNTTEELNLLCDAAQEIIKQQAKHYHLETSLSFHEPFPATINHPKAIHQIIQAANQNKISLEEAPSPFRWSEDFGHFTNLYPGALFGIGAGINQLPLHHPQYDFPDDIIPHGIKIFYALYKNLLLTPS